PPLDGGVVALRRFEVEIGDREFLDLSAGAWPTFERLYEARILGLFRFDAPGDHAPATFLLSTWYRSLAEWERSRVAVVAEEGDAVEAGRRFRRRRELTKRTVVRVGVPL
ncbi:MAG TPA: hypothetical protein VGR90_02230, partial [Acidimicrobiales bacterium]|nr:hypothetical protein [Acidimicrobiales bacterium]